MDLLPSKPSTVTLPIDLFNCPVCLDLPPITSEKVYQCKNGHLRCQQCEEKLRLSQESSSPKCPTCRCSMHGHELIRNVVVEKALEYVETPCPFESAGCSVRQPRRMLIKHSEECLFRSVRLCGLLGFKDCSFDAFNSHGLIEHMKIAHHIPHNTNEFTSYDYNFREMNGSSSHPTGENGPAPQIIKTVMCAHFRLSPIGSRPFFIHILKHDEKSDGFYFLCLFVGQREEDFKRFFASYYFSGSDSRKSVVSWPTAWYKHAIRNKEANTNLEEDASDYGFRLSRTMLQRIQGGAETANIFVHIRERGEEHPCPSSHYGWQSNRNESSSSPSISSS